jgi:hypothetical protein
MGATDCVYSAVGQGSDSTSGAAKVGQDSENPAVVVGSLLEPELEEDLADMSLDRLGT